MKLLGEFMIYALIASFVENAVLTRGLGANLVLYSARRRENLVGFSTGVIFITTFASGVAFWFDIWLGEIPHYYIYMPLIYIVIISIIYIGTLLLLWQYKPKVFVKVKKYMHLSAFNCSVLSALFLNSQRGGTFVEYLGFGFGTGVGFFLAGALIYSSREKLSSEHIPKPFRGFPAMMIYMGILSLAFYSLIGYNVEF